MAGDPDAPAPADRPRYRELRQDEDWSALGRGELASRDFADPLKWIPLAGDGRVWLSLGGEIRERLEIWRDWNFGAPPGADHDDAFLLSRFLLHADLHVGESLRFFVQGKSAHATDRELPRGRRPQDADVLDLQQGFVELAAPAPAGTRVVVRGGRQELLFGRQRLVGPSDWTNARRAFDGVLARLEGDAWSASAFWTRPVTIRPYEWNGHEDGAELYGAVASGASAESGLRGELYWLARERDDAIWNGTTGHENRHTFGARATGPLGGSAFDFEAEAAFQQGELETEDVRAWMAAAEVGWWLREHPLSPRAHARVDYASGDDDPGGAVQTFDPLFPHAHPWYGAIDAVGRSNAVDLSAGVALRPLAAVHAEASLHRLLRADDDDALYDVESRPIRAGALGTSRDIGTEIDLALRWQVDVHLAVGAGYAHLFPGRFIRQAGPSRGIDFTWVFATFTF